MQQVSQDPRDLKARKARPALQGLRGLKVHKDRLARLVFKAHEELKDLQVDQVQLALKGLLVVLDHPVH